ncbi:MAG: flagellar filament capping protein FliD [Methyloprofundus sp.]|nr:flagellar filament capping protein FliD [Methyloprofundus sp.]
MSNEIGSTLLNNLTKSSFDVGNMAKVLAEADVAGPRQILARNETKYNTELDALTYLQANLSAFNSYAKDLTSPALFNQYGVNSSNDSIVSASVSGKPAAGNYNIESLQLAQAHTVVTGTKYGSRSDTIGMGELLINGQKVLVDETNNTLEGLQRTINAQGVGVSASIINNGGEYQLMLTSSRSGAASEFSVSDVTGNLAGDLNFDVVKDAFGNELTRGQDAIMRVNGVEVSSASNQFVDVIEGVDFTLQSVSPAIQTISISQDPSGALDAIKEFVNVYNQLDTILKELGSYEKLTKAQLEDPEYQFKGDLAGSSLLRDLRTQVREAMSGAIDNVPGGFNNLGSVGVSFDRFGQLQIDETQLNAVANNNMQALASVFSNGGTATDNLINVIGGNDRTQTGSYEIQVSQTAERASLVGGAIELNANGKIDLLNGASFNLSVDGGEPVSVNLNNTGADTQVTMAEFISLFNSQVNNHPDIAAQGARVSLSVEQQGADSVFNLSSNRWGAGSQLDLSNIEGIGSPGVSNAGLTAGTDTGQNVDGFILMDDGVTRMNFGGTYVDPNDGRRVKISDFAVAGGGPAAVRGLEFEILGGASSGDINNPLTRGNINFSQGFGSRIFETVNNLLAKDGGLLSQRIESLNTRLEDVETKREKVDMRYERMEMKYRMQFSMLQSIMSQMQETQNFLTQTYNRPQQQ